MRAKIICYTFGKIDHQKRSKFKREFFGYEDKSNKGNYKYFRKGLISEIPNSRPIRSTIIVSLQDENKIIEFMKKYNANLKIYDIIINENELKIPLDMTPK
jgi:hypothetical protein